MTARRATRDDVPALAKFLAEAYATNAAMAGSDHARFTEDDVKRLLERSEVWIEEQDGRIVASAALEVRAFIKRVAVAPHARRNGLGDRMLALVEARARERGVDALTLMAAEDEPHLVEWYERRGYDRYARVEFPGETPPYVYQLKRPPKEDA